MSMRRSTGRELRTLRIVAFHFLTRTECMLCHKPLLSDAKETGGRVGHPIDPEFTEHHIDSNHENHSHENRAIVHRTCHKVFERVRAHLIKQGVSETTAEAKAMQAVQQACTKKGKENGKQSDDVQDSKQQLRQHSHRNGKTKRYRVPSQLLVSRVQDLGSLQTSR